MPQQSITATVTAGLEVKYVTDIYCYVGNENGKDLELSIQHAATCTGGNMVSKTHDATGVMIWPATHLLCQHIASALPGDGGIQLGEFVLELGCGCGLVGIAALRSAIVANRPCLWVATDMDDHALNLSRTNFCLNGVSVDGPSSRVWTRTLSWGCDEHADHILDQLATRNGGSKNTRFSSIAGADLVYPSTCEKSLQDLFRTVDYMLEDEGMFYLSFASRDGPRTPCKLIETASDAGFAISALSKNIDPSILRRLPPLLDSQILVLRRSNSARSINAALGTDECVVFRGLQASVLRLLEESSGEEWDAPYDPS
jgi:hypothetical protein